VIRKCSWAQSSAIEEAYHDHEWGVPLHDDRQLFEFLVLEGAQAGLSWRTILAKRDAYRQAFDGFDPVTISGYNDNKIEALMCNVHIVRNRLKINATINNSTLSYFIPGPL
jgi:DNA-3-methyladenine glycosylase I